MSSALGDLIFSPFHAQSETLADASGYSQAVSSFVRIIGPGGASILFAVSVDKHIMDGNLIWLVAVIVAVLGVYSGIIQK